MAATYCETGSIVGMDPEKFDADDASTRLRKAMKGLGTDELQIIKVLTEHNNVQRQEIKTKYKTNYGRDLIEDLKSELAGNFESLCLYMLMPTRHFDAFCLRNAMKGIGTKEVHLIDVLVSRSNDEIQDIKKAYTELYERDLEQDVKSDVDGDFERVLVSLLQGMRKDDESVDEELAKSDMRDLYNGGEGMKHGTDEDVFTKVLVTRSRTHLNSVFQLYKEYAEKDIEDSIRSEFSGDVMNALLAIVGYIKNPMRFFAKCLFDSMDGPGTDDERLMQLMVSHAEVDLPAIETAYKDLYNVTLAKHIKDDTSGDYRKLLLKLTAPEDVPNYVPSDETK